MSHDGCVGQKVTRTWRCRRLVVRLAPPVLISTLADTVRYDACCVASAQDQACCLQIWSKTEGAVSGYPKFLYSQPPHLPPTFSYSFAAPSRYARLCPYVPRRPCCCQPTVRHQRRNMKAIEETIGERILLLHGFPTVFQFCLGSRHRVLIARSHQHCLSLHYSVASNHGLRGGYVSAPMPLLSSARAEFVSSPFCPGTHRHDSSFATLSSLDLRRMPHRRRPHLLRRLRRRLPPGVRGYLSRSRRGLVLPAVRPGQEKRCRKASGVYTKLFLSRRIRGTVVWRPCRRYPCGEKQERSSNARC